MGHRRSAAHRNEAGMNREEFRDELDRVRRGIRRDIRSAVTRVDGFLYSIYVSAKVRVRKTKRAAKQMWHEMWR